MEAAEEFARQSRLRDLSGLIVIDFIDMEEGKNRNLVEKKLKEAMKKDRARIQIGEISSFGLLELSRQRLRPSVVENSSELCPQCGGSGRIQSIEVSAIQILRSIEEEGNNESNVGINIYAHSDLILHILNKKRSQLNEIETRYNISINFINDNSIIPPQKKLETIKNNYTENDQIEIKSNLIVIDDNENQTRKKRGNRVNKRKKRAPKENNNEINPTLKDQEPRQTKNIDQDSSDETPTKKNKTKKTKSTIKKSSSKIKNKSKVSEKKLGKETKSELETEKNQTEIREIKSSSPIEVTQINEISISETPKKKGWWSQ